MFEMRLVYYFDFSIGLISTIQHNNDLEIYVDDDVSSKMFLT